MPEMPQGQDVIRSYVVLNQENFYSNVVTCDWGLNYALNLSPAAATVPCWQ